MRNSLFLLPGCLWLMSCYTPRYMYSPPAHNVPVLVKQGDSKVSAMYSSNLSQRRGDNEGPHESRNRGYDLQGAVAVTNNLAIQASYFNRRESNNGDTYQGKLDSSFLNYKRNLTEVGIGYFKSLSRQNLVLFQVFGGVGTGRFSFTDNGKDLNSLAYSRFHQADVTRFYVQPAMLFRTRGSFAASISTRLGIMKYSKIKTDYTPDELMAYKLDDLSRGARTFWEPAITNSFDFRRLPGLRLEYQFGVSTLLSSRLIDYRSFNFSAAVVLDLPKLLRGNSTPAD